MVNVLRPFRSIEYQHHVRFVAFCSYIAGDHKTKREVRHTLDTDVYVVLRLFSLSCVFIGLCEGVFIPSV